MKLKNVLLLGSCLTLGFFSGCIDEEEPANKAAGVTVVISTNDVQTKAAATGYDIATAEEVNISNYLIAVFKNNACVALKSGTPTTKTTTTDDSRATKPEVQAYSESFTDLPTGDLTFLVIANSTANFSTLKVGSLYSDFSGYVETALTDGSLVKVGQKTVTLSASATAQEVKVPLTQLSVRIDFGSVTLNKGTQSTQDSKDYAYGDWTTLSNGDTDATSMIKSLKITGGTWTGSEYFTSDNSYKYVFQERTVTVTTSSSSSTPSFVVNTAKVSGYNTKTDLMLLPDTSVIENKQFEAGAEKAFTNTFYTYESTSNSAYMTLTLNCTIAGSGTVKTYKQLSYIRYAADGSSWKAGVETDLAFENSTYLQSTSTGQTSIVKDYTLVLPFNSNGISLKKGHRYTVNGTYTQNLTGKPIINWYVSELGKIVNTITHE